MSNHQTDSWDAKAYRGSRWKNSSTGHCPYCGQPLSHGLRGDPNTRKVPPCLRPKRAGQLAANLQRAKPRDVFANGERFARRQVP